MTALKHSPHQILVLLLWLAACQQTPVDTGLSPAESLASLQVMEGFDIALVASEPLLRDPVAMEIDEAFFRFSALIR